MIFAKPILERVLDGKATLTRRPIHDGEVECRWRIGRDYAVQSGPGKEAITRIVVRDIDRQLLADVDYLGMVREGFKSSDEFWAFWRNHIGDPAPGQKVWVIRFHLIRVQQAPTRLLAKTSGYTDIDSRALSHEPEAVDATYQRALSSGKREAWRAEHPIPKRKEAPKLIDQVERALRIELASYRGQDAEDVRELAPHQGTPGDIRRRRRALGLRGTDGLNPIPALEADRHLSQMLANRASVRDVARVFDCSIGKAHQIIRAREDQAA